MNLKKITLAFIFAIRIFTCMESNKEIQQQQQIKQIQLLQQQIEKQQQQQQIKQIQLLQQQIKQQLLQMIQQIRRQRQIQQELEKLQQKSQESKGLEELKKEPREKSTRDKKSEKESGEKSTVKYNFSNLKGIKISKILSTLSGKSETNNQSTSLQHEPFGQKNTSLKEDEQNTKEKLTEENTEGKLTEENIRFQDISDLFGNYFSLSGNITHDVLEEFISGVQKVIKENLKAINVRMDAQNDLWRVLEAIGSDRLNFNIRWWDEDFKFVMFVMQDGDYSRGCCYNSQKNKEQCRICSEALNEHLKNGKITQEQCESICNILTQLNDDEETTKAFEAMVSEFHNLFDAVNIAIRASKPCKLFDSVDLIKCSTVEIKDLIK